MGDTSKDNSFRQDLELTLLSSSTKRRISKLDSLVSKLKNDELDVSQLKDLWHLLFSTHSFYVDRTSRLKAEKCLSSLLNTSQASTILDLVVATIKNEASKGALAATNYFTLTEWTCVLLEELLANQDLWAKYSLILCDTLAICLEKTIATARSSVRHSVTIATRRTLRKIFRHKELGGKAISEFTTRLCEKGTSPTAYNAVLLGFVAGVCTRLPQKKEVFAEQKTSCLAFYTREFLASRVRLPDHLVEGLKDVFETYVLLQDFQKEVIPAAEKALLRAPEVVLNNLIAPVVNALPESIDLSESLSKNFLKPLLSNIKSTNNEIRQGALRTFKSLTQRSHVEQHLTKVLDEILNPLKQNKVTVADQKILHVEFIESLPSLPSLVTKIATGLGAVAAKEANDTILEHEVKAITKHINYGLKHDVKVCDSYLDPFTKGLGEKRLSARRIWAIAFGDINWNLTQVQVNQPEIANFSKTVLSKTKDSFKEVLTNPNSAAQNGAATVVLIATALSLTKLSDTPDQPEILKNAILWDGKPGYLVNPRIFSKLSDPIDQIWAIRAVLSVSDAVSTNKCTNEFQKAWGQAVLYFFAAQGIDYHVRKEVNESLSQKYLLHPGKISNIFIDALWTFLRDLHMEEKDSIAIISKGTPESAGSILKAICLTVSQKSKLNAIVPEEVLVSQMVQLLVLARPELLPRISWIETCLKIGVDPGDLVQSNISFCLEQIRKITDLPSDSFSTKSSNAAYSAAADLAFVASEVAIPALLIEMRNDLNPIQLLEIGETEAAIFRTPPGITYIDVLSTKSVDLQRMHKNAKDYDNLKWEEEMRLHLAQKSKQPKKLSAEEQSKVKAQLNKESIIRQNIALIQTKLKRGVGIIQTLANGPSNQTELWIVQAIDMLQEIIEANAGLILGNQATNAYLDCSRSVSNRIGPLRVFIGVATLRAIGVNQLPHELMTESLEQLTTRVLYRLRFTAETRPFDAVSLAYMLPLVLLVLDHGGFAKKNSEESDEQLVLALEFLSYHTEQGSSERLPRHKILSSLISAMQRFNQHYRLIKDCLQGFITNIGPTITEQETQILLTASISSQATVRNAVLLSIDNDLDLSDLKYSEEIWIGSHDVVAENAEIAQTIWLESGMMAAPESAIPLLKHLESSDRQLRTATAAACAETIGNYWKIFSSVIEYLKNLYLEKAKPPIPQKDEYGMIKKSNLEDPWEARSGVALAFKALASKFDKDECVPFIKFMIEQGPVGDRNEIVRDEQIDAVKTVIQTTASTKVEELMKIFEAILEDPARRASQYDRSNEAIIILYGALAGHLKSGDSRVPVVVNRLLDTLSTPSEAVQTAVAECLPLLIRSCSSKASEYVERMMRDLLESKSYASRRGAAYGLAGIVKGLGIMSLKQFRIMSALKIASEAKKDQNQRQGTFLAYELLSFILGQVFEPYLIEIVPQLLAGLGDPVGEVRDACFDASRACFAKLSSYGVKKILPILLEGLDESQWRSKKGACEALGAMAHLDPQQLAQNLPEIIPPLANVLNDSHKEVRLAANRSLQRFGDVITNPEIKNIVSILLKALSDPVRHTDDALDSLITIQFVHYLDSSSLALVTRILERGLGDRSQTKRKSAQIIGSLAHLTERKDLTTHLPILVAGLRGAIVDPVPGTRATASKALGSLVEKLGEDALPDLIPSLMNTLKADTGAGDRLGSAQALSEVLAGLGTSRLEETLPGILQNVASSKASVREGFMSLFIFLPACFGNSFSNYLSKIIPPILAGLADDVESIRETALRAGRLLVKNFSTRAIDLLLPSLENGLADDSYRIRLSSVELVGDLLFNLTGIAAKAEKEDEEDFEDIANEAGQSLLEVLGEERRDRVLSAIYICRCDVSGLVRAAAINVWKALVATPRTLREITPTLTQLIITRLASSNIEQKVIAGNALGELIRKSGEGMLFNLLPSLDDGLKSTNPQSRQGICIALRDIITSSAPEALEDHEQALISIIKTALVDSDVEVREAAAEAFDALQRVFGKRAIDQVLPSLLNLLRSTDEARNALSALLTLLTDHARSNIILPNLLPTLLSSPISSFNAQAIASLAEVASSAMTRRLQVTINELIKNIISCKNDDDRLESLENALDSVLLSVDENDGLNTLMSVMLIIIKDNDYNKRKIALDHFVKFVAETEVDFSRYYPDLIRVFLVSFDDRDMDVVRAAWAALNQLTKRLKKEDMEELVIPTRRAVTNVGVAGANLPGFGVEKGIGAVLPIFIQGLTQGTQDQRIQSALAISDLADRTSADSLKPFAPTITGPLIRVVSEKSIEVKVAILETLNKLLFKIPLFLKPFVPQLQRTFVNALADSTSDVLRMRGASCLGALITMVPRVDPLITELVNKTKNSPESGIKRAVLKALYEVVRKAGSNMTETSRNSILGIIDADVDENDDKMAIINAWLLGAMIKVLPETLSESLLRNRVLVSRPTRPSILALNATLVESASTLTSPTHLADTADLIQQTMEDSNALQSAAAVLAAGKLLLSLQDPPEDITKALLTTLATLIAPGKPADVRRVSLTVLRTLARIKPEVVRSYTAVFVPPMFASVRDAVIPVKLAAEQAFVGLFDVVDSESERFDAYLVKHGDQMPAAQKRSLGDYFRRVVMRLAGQARERREAEGGLKGTLGLTDDEVDDEKEVWSVGKVEDGASGDLFT